jgi:hypothetical protein
MTATKASASPDRSTNQRCPPNRFRVAPFNYDYDTTPSRPPIAKTPRRRPQNYGYDSLPPVRQPPNRYHLKNRLPPVAVWPNRDPFRESAFGQFHDSLKEGGENVPDLNEYGFVGNATATSVDYLGGFLCKCTYVNVMPRFPHVLHNTVLAVGADSHYVCTLKNQGLKVNNVYNVLCVSKISEATSCGCSDFGCQVTKCYKCGMTPDGNPSWIWTSEAVSGCSQKYFK